VRRGGKGGRGGRNGKAEGEERRREVGKGEGGDKSPAWSSQNLGSTVSVVYVKKRTFNFITPPQQKK